MRWQQRANYAHNSGWSRFNLRSIRPHRYLPAEWCGAIRRREARPIGNPPRRSEAASRRSQLSGKQVMPRRRRGADSSTSFLHISETEVRILSPRQVGFELRCAGREFYSFSCALAQCVVRSRNDHATLKTSQKIAHFLLDFLCKQSVCGGQRSPHAERLRLQGPQSSPPPAPLCLRGVAVVAAR
jgi:hypothetical protein